MRDERPGFRPGRSCAQAGVERAREGLIDATTRLHQSVRDALADGVRADDVADLLGVSRVRVYQMRDGRR